MQLSQFAVYGVTVLAYSREHAESLVAGPTRPSYALSDDACPDTEDACPATSRTPFSPRECYPMAQGSR